MPHIKFTQIRRWLSGDILTGCRIDQHEVVIQEIRIEDTSENVGAVQLLLARTLIPLQDRRHRIVLLEYEEISVRSEHRVVSGDFSDLSFKTPSTFNGNIQRS